MMKVILRQIPCVYKMFTVILIRVKNVCVESMNSTLTTCDESEMSICLFHNLKQTSFAKV